MGRRSSSSAPKQTTLLQISISGEAQILRFSLPFSLLTLCSFPSGVRETLNKQTIPFRAFPEFFCGDFGDSWNSIWWWFISWHVFRDLIMKRARYLLGLFYGQSFKRILIDLMLNREGGFCRGAAVLLPLGNVGGWGEVSCDFTIYSKISRSWSDLR